MKDVVVAVAAEEGAMVIKYIWKGTDVEVVTMEEVLALEDGDGDGMEGSGGDSGCSCARDGDN